MTAVRDGPCAHHAKQLVAGTRTQGLSWVYQPWPVTRVIAVYLLPLECAYGKDSRPSSMRSCEGVLALRVCLPSGQRASTLIPNVTVAPIALPCNFHAMNMSRLTPMSSSCLRCWGVATDGTPAHYLYPLLQCDS
jgi:hypothetical protein